MYHHAEPTLPQGFRMRHVSRFTPLLLLVCLIASCARARVASDAQEEDRSSGNRLIRQDILGSGERTLYDVIERLRPRWLRVRSITSVRGPVPIVVYHDNVRVGGIATLRSLRPEGIQEVRFISASDATTRWGMGLSSGAIEVISRRVQRDT